MASNSEKLLLKQITDLTRQIEKQKRGFGTNEFQFKKFVKPVAKKSQSTLYSSHVNGTQHWHKPALPNVTLGQPGTSTIHPKPLSKPLTSGQHSFQSNTPTIQNVTTKPKQVFVNPNFVPQKVGSSVHVNPNFRSQSSILHTAKATKPLAGPPAAVPGSIPPRTVAAQAAPSGRQLGASGGGASVQAAPVAGRSRRRSLSSSPRYRLLTARKLVRRLSKDGCPPSAPAGQAAVHTRHKLVRVAGTPRAQLPARKLVSTRHKLVRVTSTPRTQPPLRRLTLNRAAGATSWCSTRAAAGPARPGASSRYQLVRAPGPARPGASSRYQLVRAAGPAPSQHRTWRRRSSSGSTPVSRLTSGGRLRLGSTRFVNIGGLLYKSTARKLQRAIAKPAQKNSNTSTAAAAGGVSPGWISVRGARFRVEAGGRSLRRLDTSRPAPPRLDIGGLTFRAAGDGTLTADSRQQASRSLISRAKSRSLAVLRDSLRLSRQPCRFFCRLGRCQRHERGLCPHVHEAALRPVCSRHLQEGGCQRPGCAYNHAPRPEKVPHCLHFLTAECRRESCPYQHVNVDADAPLCARFLAGFCARGQQCTDKHLYICPEFSEQGKCPRGATCPLAHRARRRRRRQRTPSVAATGAPPRGRGRYYLGGEAGLPSDAAPETAPETETDGDGGGRQRPAMAEMPSFIAIGDSSGDDE